MHVNNNNNNDYYYLNIFDLNIRISIIFLKWTIKSAGSKSNNVVRSSRSTLHLIQNKRATRGECPDIGPRVVIRQPHPQPDLFASTLALHRAQSKDTARGLQYWSPVRYRPAIPRGENSKIVRVGHWCRSPAAKGKEEKGGEAAGTCGPANQE